ncbi:branched-chain amino acid ABC transporter permease [Pseudorhodoplanes sinuspersici]|uniref:branched-chain amino acid ABC transporter permease n=1 Tax=Pseudorhodoplanes sinuspersici TaxID=1235591 RepID=UPI001FD8A5F7|nr:branched-chain amino acid ABC transporter permease [Pseudorhodoplanes sinuspersici]
MPSTETAWPPLVRRFPRLVIVGVVGLVFAALAFLLHAENQISVVAVLVSFVALIGVVDGTAIGRDLTATCRRHAGFGNGVALIGALALVVLFRDDHYTLLMMTTVALYAAACIGLNLQLAFAGVVNFAGAAFFAIGSYTAAILGNHTALPHLLVLAGCGIVAGVLGLCVLLPVLRTRGHYAALVTIAFGLLIRTFLEVNDLLGGPQGLKVPGLDLFGLQFNNVREIGPIDLSFYVPYAVFGILLFAGAFVLVRLIENSWIGISLDAVRADEVAASVFGLSIAYWKAFAFLVGNMLIGVAGGAYGMMNGFINPNGAGLGDSLILLSIIVLGGLGNLWGTIGAAVVILVLPEKLQAIQEYRLLIFAILVMLILRFRPSGIMPRSLRMLSRVLSRGERA